MIHKTYYILALTYPLRGVIRLIARALIFIRKKEITLVFGMSRSGTTMLGKFLSLGPSTQYVHEPELTLMTKVFTKINGSFDHSKFWGEFIFSKDYKQFKVHCFVCAALRSVLTARRNAKMICIKSITLNDVLNETVCAIQPKNVIYIARHPCGRSESILRQINKDIFSNPDSVSKESFEQLGRDWGGMTREVQRLFNEHPEWKWVFFENITGNPIHAFKKLYEDLGLEWNETIHNKIIRDTKATDGSFYDTKRDSSKEADKWRDAFTEEQIQFIRNGCLPFETNLYESF